MCLYLYPNTCGFLANDNILLENDLKFTGKSRNKVKDTHIYLFLAFLSTYVFSLTSLSL